MLSHKHHSVRTLYLHRINKMWVRVQAGSDRCMFVACRRKTDNKRSWRFRRLEVCRLQLKETTLRVCSCELFIKDETCLVHYRERESTKLDCFCHSITAHYYNSIKILLNAAEKSNKKRLKNSLRTSIIAKIYWNLRSYGPKSERQQCSISVRLNRHSILNFYSRY